MTPNTMMSAPRQQQSAAPRHDADYSSLSNAYSAAPLSASSASAATLPPSVFDDSSLPLPLFSVPTADEIKNFPIHAKNVPQIDFSALERLPITRQVNLDNWFDDKRYLVDASLYETALSRDGSFKADPELIPGTGISKAHIERLAEVGVTREITIDEIRGFVRMFTVVEPHKKRLRPIKYTYEANDVFDRETLRQLTFPTKKDICNFVLAGSHFAAFDFAAYYDQFTYDPKVGRFFCFKKGKKYYCLNKLAMGQRQAVQTAESATTLILDFPGRRCKVVRSVIDNVIFVGSYEDVLHDSKIFLERCKIVNAALNDIEQIELEGPDFYIKTVDDWCGVRIDSKNKTVSLTKKTVDKLSASWNNRKNWSWRNFAAHIGLLFWTWGIIEVPIETFHPLLNFISATSRLLQEDVSLWDQPANVFNSVWPNLIEWTNLALNNRPRLVKPSTDLKWYVVTDASSWGWGYVAFDMATGAIQSYGQQWSKDQLAAIFSRRNINKIKKSVYSEPLAIYNSLCHLLQDGSPKDLHISSTDRLRVHVATDNSAAQHTFNRGFASRSFDINKSIEKLRAAFPASDFDISYSYIPGYRNPADVFSRGKVSNVTMMTGKQQQGWFNMLRSELGIEGLSPDQYDLSQNRYDPKSSSYFSSLFKLFPRQNNVLG